jgi:hypothetical protein
MRPHLGRSPNREKPPSARPRINATAWHPNGCQFGVHQFSYRDPTPDDLDKSQRLSAKIAKYIQEMGIPADFMEVSADTPWDKISLLSEERLHALKVITGGDTGVEWTVNLVAGLIYVRGERDTTFGHQKVLFAHSDTDGFQFYAFIEAQGREHELTTFPSVEIVLNGEAGRIDISERCARAPSGENVVMIFTKLTETEASAVANSDSFGVIVRANPDAPVFLGISAMPSKGAEDKLKALYTRFASDRR